MKVKEREALLEKLAYERRLGFVAFCTERCLAEARRMRAATEQLAALPAVTEALEMLWTAAAGTVPEPGVAADLADRVRAAATGTQENPRHPAVKAAADVLVRGLDLVADPSRATPSLVASAADGPAILAATLYASEMEARRAEAAVHARALERLRDSEARMSRAFFDALEDWPRTPLHARFVEESEKSVRLTSVPEILKAIAAAAPDDRGALVRTYASKLKTHFARLYVTEPSDEVREALERTFLALGAAGRNKVAASLTAMLPSAPDAERARALRGIAFLARIDCPAPPAATLVAFTRSGDLAVRAGALRCLGRLSPEQVDATVPGALLGGITDADETIRRETLETLHDACDGGPYRRQHALSSFRAVIGLAPDGSGHVDPALLERLAQVVEAGTEQERRMALAIVTKLGAAARPIALAVARAFASNDDVGFAEALLALQPLPEDCRAPITSAAARSPSNARSANEVLEKAFGVRIPLAERIAQIERALASSDRDERISALMAAAALPRAAGAALPIVLAHGAKVVARLGEGEERDSELSFTRDALRALGCPPDDLPHRPSRLEAFRGSVPVSRAHVEAGYVVATFSSTRSEAPAGIALGSVGVWDDASGKVLFVVDGAEHLCILPDRAEALAVRTKGGRGPGGAWFVERFALPSGERLTSLEVREYAFGWVAGLDVRRDGDALVATVRVGDEDGATRFRVRLGRGRDPDALVASAFPSARRGDDPRSGGGGTA